MLKVDSYALPNVLAGERVVPELMQADCTPDLLAESVLHWFRDAHAAARLQPRFRAIHAELRRGASAQAARAVAELLGAGNPPSPA
jgi:lipid-A-disaccharide synthase